jgi:hypothetical protein
MVRRIVLAVVVCVCVAAPAAQAQDPYNLSAPVRSLATLFTDLYGPNGLVLDSLATLPGEQPHSAHFNSDFQFNFTQFSTAVVNQLVTLPLPSPAGGFTYKFDPTLGVFQRTTRSFGPILADRAETIGARHISFGFAYQRFTFDSVEGLDLSRIPAVFTHDNAALLGGRQDVVTTVNSIEATISQATTFLTMGVTDSLDVSVAIPFVGTDMNVVSRATIHRLGTTNPLTHFFRQANGEVGVERSFTANASAAGLGDVTIRAKHAIWRGAAAGIAIGMDLRLPTGNEMNLLGSGAAGFQPFAIFSATYENVSPHANVSYRKNGSSVLAGNPATGESAHFPDAVTYAAGIDMALNPRLTLALDLLGRYVIDADRLRTRDFHALDAQSVFPNISFARESFNALTGAAGLKAHVVGRLLVDVNLLFKLDEHGLRDKVTPLIGLEYTF